MSCAGLVLNLLLSHSLILIFLIVFFLLRPVLIVLLEYVKQELEEYFNTRDGLVEELKFLSVSN